MDTVLDSLSMPAGAPSEWPLMPAGKIQISVNAACQWFYQEQPILNQAIIAHFNSRLFIHDGAYYLASDWQKLRITVDDVPYLIVDMEASSGGVLVFRTQFGETVPLVHQRDWQLKTYGESILPYVHVRDGLWARMGRAPYYRLAEEAKFIEQEGTACMVIQSGDQVFPLGFC